MQVMLYSHSAVHACTDAVGNLAGAQKQICGYLCEYMGIMYQ